jgi:hypothetical protein
MPKRLTVTLKRRDAMQVTPVSIGKKKLVYVIVTKKALRYPWGRSRVAYIGTTKKGMARFAQSAAAKAQDVLSLHGVREFSVRILTCGRRQSVKTWEKLERGLLIIFRQKYGALPKCNTAGKRMKARNEFRYFRRDRLEKALEMLG